MLCLITVQRRRPAQTAQGEGRQVALDTNYYDEIPAKTQMPKPPLPKSPPRSHLSERIPHSIWHLSVICVVRLFRLIVKFCQEASDGANCRHLTRLFSITHSLKLLPLLLRRFPLHMHLSNRDLIR